MLLNSHIEFRLVASDRRTAITADCNSIFGIVNFLIGVTLDLAVQR